MADTLMICPRILHSSCLWFRQGLCSKTHLSDKLLTPCTASFHLDGSSSVENSRWSGELLLFSQAYKINFTGYGCLFTLQQME